MAQSVTFCRQTVEETTKLRTAHTLPDSHTEISYTFTFTTTKLKNTERLLLFDLQRYSPKSSVTFWSLKKTFPFILHNLKGTLELQVQSLQLMLVPLCKDSV